MSSALPVLHNQVFNASTLSVELVVNIDQSTADDYLISDFWFRNGNPLPSAAKTAFHPQFDKTVRLIIQNPITLDIGLYETQLKVNKYSKITCDNPSPYTSNSFMGTNYAVIESNIQQLLYSGIMGSQ